MPAKGISVLLQQIISKIYQNNSDAITGQILQDQFVDVVDSLHKGTYNNLLPYNADQFVIYQNGVDYSIYLCVTNTTPGESPINTPTKWVEIKNRITITDTFVVVSEVAMLALDAQTGDIAIRTDENQAYILQGSDPTTLGDWLELPIPLSSIVSVFGRTDSNIVAESGDYDAEQIDETATRVFVSPEEKTVLQNTSGENTGDQDLSGLIKLDQTTPQTVINGRLVFANGVRKSKKGRKLR